MKKLIALTVFTLALPALAQQKRATTPLDSFASDFQTVPVMANTAGLGGAQFQSYVALFNPTAASIPVTASFYDATGTKRSSVITLAAGELKTYSNFLADVFNATGGGAVTFQAPSHDNRFIVSTEVRTGSNARYSTSVPVLEFAGSSSRSFAAGVTVDSNSRTNIGCFNQSDGANTVTATVFDNSGKQTLGTLTLNLAPNAWTQAPVTSIVSGGYIQFDPSDSAVCYAVVVDNTTNDGRFINAVEYRP